MEPSLKSSLAVCWRLRVRPALPLALSSLPHDPLPRHSWACSHCDGWLKQAWKESSALKQSSGNPQSKTFIFLAKEQQYIFSHAESIYVAPTLCQASAEPFLAHPFLTYPLPPPSVRPQIPPGTCFPFYLQCPPLPCLSGKLLPRLQNLSSQSFLLESHSWARRLPLPPAPAPAPSASFCFYIDVVL